MYFIQNAGFGGFQRGEQAGIETLATAALNTIKDANVVQVGGLLLTIIDLNPTTRFIKNTAGVGIISYATYKGLEYGAGKVAEWSALQLTKKLTIQGIQDRLLSLLRDKYISIDTYNAYLVQVSKTKKLSDLLELSKMLLEKVFTRL